jgi:hypothetical protein
MRLTMYASGAVWLATTPFTFAAAITYISAPNLCTGAAGYTGLPYCSVPGEVPLGTFLAPLPGGSYLDPNFGGMVRILTGTPYVHIYSQPSPISAHNRYLGLLGQDSGRYSIVDFTTGSTAYDSLAFSDAWVWDAYNDDTHYRIEGSRILKTILSSGQETVLIDYSQTAQHFTSISAGGSTDTSKDNWLAFQAPDQHQICAVDLNTVRTYCADYMAAEATSRIGWEWFDYVMISKGTDSTNGKRYVLLIGGPAMGVWSVNAASGRLDFEYRGPDNWEWGSNHDGYCDPGEFCLTTPHADVMEDSAGKQYLVTTKGQEAPCSLQLVTMDLSKGRSMFWPESAGGGLKTVLNLANCGEMWPTVDLGCAKNAPYCVISTSRTTSRPSADSASAFPDEPYRDQIAILRGNGQEVRFLAATRSVNFDDDTYWPRPRAALSPDGQYVVFTSNFGVDGRERVAVLSTQPPADPVKAVSVSPAAAAGSQQTLTLTYSDVAGASDLSVVSVWIRTGSDSPASGSCVIQFDRSASLLKLADDSGSAWNSISPGAAGTLDNTQCSVNASTATVTAGSNSLTLALPITLKPAFGGAKQVWLSASGNAGSSGWKQLGAWSPPPPGVRNTSVSPSSGGGAAQTFVATWTADAGSSDISSASVWLAAGAGGAANSSCLITWTRAGNQFKLADDAGIPSAAAQNSQCSIDLSSSRAIEGGNTLSLSLPVTFKAAYQGVKGVWMSAAGSASASTWQQLGSWTVPGAGVTNTSIAPASGNSATQTFTAAWTNIAGSTTITSAVLWITSSTAKTTSSCYVAWSRSTNRFTLLDDSGAASPAGQNSQCVLDAATAKATDGGPALTLSVPLSFKPAFGGTKGLWMTASSGRLTSPLQQLGTWTIPGPLATNTSVSPNSGAGAAQTFTAVWTDTAGSADLTSAEFRITSGGSAAASGCNVIWTSVPNTIKLLDDSGVPGSAPQNSQCTLDVTAARAIAAGNTLTLTLPITFKPSFTGSKEIWMSAGGVLAGSAWQKLGSWTLGMPGVSAVSASPSTGQGSGQTFTLTYADSAGANDLLSAYFMFTRDFNGGGPTCMGYYDQIANVIRLLNDSFAWVSAIRGAPVTLENSQCAIDAGAITVSTNGSLLMLSMPVNFKSSFAGPKELWMSAGGGTGHVDWVKLGTWTVQ